MKILLYSDNHWATSTSVLRQRGKRYSLKLENQIESINWVNQVAEEMGCDKIICLGDFFDKPELNAEELTALKEIEVKHHMFIVGNHEINSSDLKYSSAHLFSGQSKVFDKPEIIKLGTRDTLILPYTTDSTRHDIGELIKSLNVNPSELLILSHNDIKDIQYGPYKSTVGYPKQDILDNCKLFINGHIHNAGTFEQKIINIGSLTGINFNNDSDNYKNGIIILDTETLEVKLVENPYSLKFYKAELNSVEDVESYVHRRADGKSIFNLKVPESISIQTNKLLETFKEKIVYKKLTLTYNVKEKINNTAIKVELNYYDKFKEFVKDHFGDGSVNLPILLEELDIIGGSQ